MSQQGREYFFIIKKLIKTFSRADDDGELKGKAKHIVEYIGIGLVVIGGLGYLYTIYEAVSLSDHLAPIYHWGANGLLAAGW